jgi:hypothetical protein
MAGAALALGIKGNSLVKREMKREKGHGVILTTPGYYDGG